MYFSFTPVKLALLVVVAITLVSSVAITYLLKYQYYGTTPPFATLGYLYQEISLRSWYGIERAAKNGLAFAGGLFSVSRTEASAGGQARAIPVLTYHRIVSSRNDLNNVTSGNFHDQMNALKDAGWETVSLAEFEAFMRGEIVLPAKSFLITFDDGAKDSFYPVDPIFSALNYEGVMYIIEGSSLIPESVYYLSPPELKRMLKTGRWALGSHSYDGHRPYPADETGSVHGIFFADKLWKPEDGRLETKEEFTARVRDDLAKAKQSLEERYQVPVDTFAFPLGNETGITGAANFPDGARITEQEARALYSFGFLQTEHRGFTYNYPHLTSFIARRIHVDHDWSGARLLQEMEQGFPKEMPYTDDFATDKGWIAAWGLLDLGRNNFALRAAPEASSASAILDGTALWDNYTMNAGVSWQRGWVFMLADVTDSKTYNACAFENGNVSIQTTIQGETRTLATRANSNVRYGTNVPLGIRVHGSTIECLVNYQSVLEAYDRTWFGGIGIQAWDPELGTATVGVTEISVTPHEE